MRSTMLHDYRIFEENSSLSHLDYSVVIAPESLERVDSPKIFNCKV